MIDHWIHDDVRKDSNERGAISGEKRDECVYFRDEKQPQRAVMRMETMASRRCPASVGR